MRTGSTLAPRLHAHDLGGLPPTARILPPAALDQLYRVREAHRAKLATLLKLEPTTQRILEATADLVRIPSQGGIDDAQPICSALIAKLAEAGLTGRVLMKGNRPVAVVAEIVGAHPGPSYALNAVVDTAPVGDEKGWSMPPFAAELRGNRLYGRGVGDSKVAAATFIEVGRELARRAGDMHGRAVLFFDASEHAGDFAGMHAFVEHYGHGEGRVQGMIIGYPGNQSLQVGSRGFHRSQWRTKLDVPGDPEAVVKAIAAPQGVVIPEGRSIEFALPTKSTITAVTSACDGPAVADGTVLDIAIRGKSGHAGSTALLGVNALVKAAAFLRALGSVGSTTFGDTFVPQVVALEGSKDFSVVPDLVRLKVFVPRAISEQAARHIAAQACCVADELLPAPNPSLVLASAAAAGERAVSAVTVNYDVRTTLACGADDVQKRIDEAVARLTADGVECTVTTVGSCPAFRVPDTSPVSQAMQRAITKHSSKPVQPRLSGPANAGNVAAELGMHATAGFGPSCKHAHGEDESIDTTTIWLSYMVHKTATELLFKMTPRDQTTPAPEGAVV